MAKTKPSAQPASPERRETRRTTAPPANGRELLDMDQAIAILKTTRPTFYRWLRSGRVKGMKVGRQWRFYREDIERFVKGQGPRIELAGDIGPLIRELRDRLGQIGAKAPPATGQEEVVEAVDLMIRLAVAMQASDIHLEPGEGAMHLRLRIDGVLHSGVTYDPRLHPAIVERWKALAACDIHEKVRPQDGRALVEFQGAREPVDLRVCFLPAYLGESLTIRLLRREEMSFSLGRIDYLPRDRQRLLKWLGAPWGLVLVTGPTGSGKTTVLYSCLAHLVGPARKLMSIEDPVEYVIPGIVQVPLREKEGVTFTAAVRAFLRSDPDVIMIGEIRGLEPLDLACRAALTGHLVLTTLHTDDAVGALRRMLDVGASAFIVADATKLIVAQRLVRRLCPGCSTADTPSDDGLRQAESLARAGGADWPGLAREWRRPVGCEKCRFTGHRGRTVIAEMLEVTPGIGAALRCGASAVEIRAMAVGQGMTTMAAHGILRAAAGETSLDEVLSVAPPT